MQSEPFSIPSRALKVFVLCSGLGRINRGFESFTQECFDALRNEPGLTIYLFKGGGTSHGREIRLANIKRNGRLAKLLNRVTGRDGHVIEQATFTLSLLPYLMCFRPDVIYFSDGNIGNLLWKWRQFTKGRYKLLLSNGAPYSPPHLPRCDLIQQVTPSHLQGAIEGGISATRQMMVPYGNKMPDNLEMLTAAERKLLRKELGLPENRPLVLSVGAINIGHKRMDYLIREIAKLPEPCPFLLMLGQQDAESPAVLQLACDVLGAESFSARTVAPEAISAYYQAADLFVLCSLGEGFGRVFLEAMSFGLPCLAHDYEVARFVLADEGWFADFAVAGSLKSLLETVFIRGDDPIARYRRFRSVTDRFGWDNLRSRYSEMIKSCAKMQLPSNGCAFAN